MDLKINKVPHIHAVLPYFIAGALFFLLLSVLIVLESSHLFSPYFDNILIALNHIAVLGWATMIIMGALFQLIPVIFETSLFSEKLAIFNFWLFVVSILFLIYTFWVGAFTSLLKYASAAIFLSLLLFVLNVLITYKKSDAKNKTSKFVIVSVCWLAITALIGTLISLNFSYNFLTEIHLHYLKIHATIGFVGWFLLLIMGVGATLIPMFLISHELNHKKLNASFYLINTGLFLLILNWFFVSSKNIEYGSWALIVLGILFFISFIYDSYKKRMRNTLDIGMQYSVVAIANIFIPIVLSIIVLNDLNIDYDVLNRIVILYALSIIFGFITTLILGQTYKTLPFIVWLVKYQNLVGKTKTPLPKELFSEKYANIQFYVYGLFLVSIGFGVITHNIVSIQIGSWALLLVAILYNIIVFKIIFHKMKSVKNGEKSNHSI